MLDRGESGTTMENPVSNGEQHFERDPRLDHHGHPAPCDWMTGGGRGRRRAMMMSMMMDPRSGMMDGRSFGFGGRGGRGGRGGWFGFGGRGRGNGRRDRYRHGWRCEVDDEEENVTSMAEQMDECHLYEGCAGDGCGSSESSSSSSSSESDDEQNAPNDDVQEQQPNDGDVHEMEGQSKDPAQQETMKSNDKGLEKDKPSSSRGCNRGNRRREHGRGHHKHRHGKHKHRCHPAFHHSMVPPPPIPHFHGFHRPPFPPMHLPHHCFPDFYDDGDMARKFFKRSMKQWYKAQKRAWKQRQGFHHRVQRSDGDEATSGCDNEDDFEHPETRCQPPPPWLYYSYDHYGPGHGRRGVFRHGKKGKKHGKRRGQCNCGRPLPAEDTPTQTAAKDRAGALDEVEKANEVREDGQAPMEDTAE